MKIQLEAILASVDTDKDDRITVREMLSWFRGKESLVRSESKEFQREHQELFYQFKAEDTVAYHDMDNDMIVSRQELWDSLVQWNVVRFRILHGLKLVNRADRAGLEAFERSLDYLRRDPMQLPTKLRPELEQLFSLRKGTEIFRSLKGVNSFSDSEFFSEARQAIHQLLQRQGRSRVGEL